MQARDLSREALGQDDVEIQLHRFNKLMTEVIRGSVERNSFQPWEFELLMDMDRCHIDRRRRVEILRQYQRAVNKQLEDGAGPPMLMSVFLETRARRHQERINRRSLSVPESGIVH